jgi:hypothetical protein
VTTKNKSSTERLEDAGVDVDRRGDADPAVIFAVCDELAAGGD